MKNVVTLYSRTGYQLIQKGVSDNGLAVYVALKSLYNSNSETMRISIDDIHYKLTNELMIKKNDNRVKQYKNALTELNDNKVINIIQQDKNNYIIDMSNLYQDTTTTKEVYEINPFDNTVMYDEEPDIVTVNNYYYEFELSDIQNILKDNGGRKNIIRYLFYMLYFKSENGDMYYFQRDREELAYDTNMDIRTIDSYNLILNNNHIIYCRKSEYKWKDSNRTIHNLYGLYKDKDIIDDTMNKFIREHGEEIIRIYPEYNKGKNTVKKEKNYDYTPKCKRGFPNKNNTKIDIDDEEDDDYCPF